VKDLAFIGAVNACPNNDCGAQVVAGEDGKRSVAPMQPHPDGSVRYSWYQRDPNRSGDRGTREGVDEYGNPIDIATVNHTEVLRWIDVATMSSVQQQEDPPRPPIPDPSKKDPCGHGILVSFSSGLDRKEDVKDKGNGAVTLWPFMYKGDVAYSFNKAIEEINSQIDSLGFTEMFRPSGYQAELKAQADDSLAKYNQLPWLVRSAKTKPLPADPVGSSSHEAAMAFDIPLEQYGPDEIEIITAAFVKNGFVQGVQGDPVHFVWKDWLSMTPAEKKKLIDQAQADYKCHWKGRGYDK
jgi:hypothetical protein